MSEIKLPSYLADSKPNGSSNRAAWFKNTAPAYAGIILWFVFWNDVVNTGTAGGGLAQGIALPIIAIIVAALLSHFLFYLVPGLFGMKTGRGLAVVGSSIFGATGGIIMPGLLMGLLQFGWVAVNTFFAAILLSQTITFIPVWGLMIIWGGAATFMGLKGIKYVAGISTYLPLIPLAVLILLVVKTIGTVSNFDPAAFTALSAASGGVVPEPISAFAIFGAIVTYIVGFFATAGAAGVDFGTNARNAKDVQFGGIVGVALAMIFTGVAAVLILAGAYGNPETAKILVGQGVPQSATMVLSAVLGDGFGKTCMFLLAIAAFPSACFSSLIAANSFKTMLPKINSTLSVSAGGAVAVILAITGVAGNAAGVFGFIGASFGPICGAMVVDYFLSGGEWSGPRRGVNIAGWLSWAIGFAVGVMPNFGIAVPMAPVAAFFAGAIVYFVAMKAGLKSDTVSLK